MLSSFFQKLPVSPSFSCLCPCVFGVPRSDRPFLSPTCFQGRRSWMSVLNVPPSIPGGKIPWSDRQLNPPPCGASTAAWSLEIRSLALLQVGGLPLHLSKGTCWVRWIPFFLRRVSNGSESLCTNGKTVQVAALGNQIRKKVFFFFYHAC